MEVQSKIAGVMGSGNANLPGTDGSTKKSQESVISDNLKRFEVDGKIDVDKLATSFINLEKEFHKTAQERAALSKSYEILANSISQKVNKGDAVDDREQLMDSPGNYVSGVARETLEEMGRPIVDALIEMTHPEIGKNPDGTYKNPEFMDGLKRYIDSFPIEVRQSLANFNGADWTLKQYKMLLANSKGNNSVPVKKPFSEVPSSSNIQKRGGKVWTREEVRDLMLNKPAEYAKHADEITASQMESL